MTLTTEKIQSEQLTLSASTAMESLDGNYDSYWHEFGELYGGDIQATAEKNENREAALTARLHNPSAITGNKFVDSLSPAENAKEWYLGVGSLNQLRGSSASMLLAASVLWESPDQAKLPDSKITTRFITEVGTIRRGQVPERMERAINDPKLLKRMNLSGQITLDIARIPEDEHIKERVFAADLSFQINRGLFKLLVERPNLTTEQSRVLSDSLKGQYDAKFEFLSLKRKNGEINDSDYEAGYNQVLIEQVQDTLVASKKITNGDLHESYFVALMRYALNTWQEEYSYTVMSATRRQDEPHDSFASKSLPRFSYDAVVVEPSRQIFELVQLKVGQKTGDDWDASEQPSYANGIMVLDDILQTTSNTTSRNELLTGFSQMRGLLFEIITGHRYDGGDQVIHSHVDRILKSFQI